MRVEYVVQKCDYPNCETGEEVFGSYKFYFTRSTGRSPSMVMVDLCPTHRDVLLDLSKHLRTVGTPIED